MKPLSLRIKHFRSFRKEQTFHFPQEPGLYFMLGLNESEPRLGANGTGKSSIWDALFWVLFERTPRGLKAGDVCHWEEKGGTEVAFDFLLDDESPCIWTITRTWKPNSWRLSHQAEHITDEDVIDLGKDPANPVLAAVRLEMEPFLQSVLMAQKRPMFLDLKREPQAELFSNVLGLDRWVDYAQAASKKASAQDAISRELERRLARLDGELAQLGRNSFKADAEQWERSHRERLDALADAHARKLRERKGLKESLERAQERESAARKALGRAQPDPRSQEIAKSLLIELRESERLVDQLKGRHKELQEQVEGWLDNIDKCPTCGQEWHEKHAAEGLLDELKLKAITLKRQIDDEESVTLNLRGRLDEKDEELEAQERKHHLARDDLDKAEREVGNARRSLELMDRELDRLEDDAERLEGERNPYKDMEKETARRGRQLREELDAVRGELDASNSRWGLLRFWSSAGFKELRLQEIAEALTELEIEVNSCVTALGLVDWELRFAVDKEGKGGGIQRGFAVTVKSPLHPYPTPWEAWSGGEGQRLLLAANMGLGDLIRARTGLSFPLEIWDEPTAGLSPEGIHDLLECLAARAQAERRIIFLVDHKAHDFGGFAGQYTIIKAPSGSRIRQGAV